MVLLHHMHSHVVWQPSFSSRSTIYLSEDVERLQKLAMEIIYPDLSYAKALELSALLTLYDRKEAIDHFTVVDLVP